MIKFKFQHLHEPRPCLIIRKMSHRDHNLIVSSLCFCLVSDACVLRQRREVRNKASCRVKIYDRFQMIKYASVQHKTFKFKFVYRSEKLFNYSATFNTTSSHRSTILQSFHSWKLKRNKHPRLIWFDQSINWSFFELVW